MAAEMKKGVTIIVFPLPFQGHINPMLNLAHILHSKGFSIAVIHNDFNSPNPSDHPNFSFHPIPAGLSEAQIRGGDVIKHITLLNQSCVDPFRSCLAKLVADAAEDQPVGCLITDAHWHFTQGVADGVGIRRIVLRTGNVASFLAMLALPLLRQKGVLPPPEANLEDPAPDFPPLKIKDLPAANPRDPDNIYELLSSVLSETKASSGLIFNSFEELEFEPLIRCAQVFSIPVFTVGPFHKQIPTASTSTFLTPDHTSISWLNTKPPKSVLYVSFGSLAAVNADEFLEIAWGLANSNVPFLWVVRPGMVIGTEWLEALPNGFAEMMGERGHIVKWAPQREALAHPAMGGFWSHGGWNSTLESICEGVPMVCYPCFGDQMANSRYVSEVWKIGVVLEGKMERGEIEKAIRKLMVERESGGMIERIEDMKKKVDCCLSEGGSSLKSLHNLVCHILEM